MTKVTDLAEFIQLVTAYRRTDGHGTGGPLHIVLDDMNVQAHHIRWCVEEWLPEHPCGPDNNQWWPERWEAHDCMAETKQIADILLSLTKRERRAWIDAGWYAGWDS